MADDTPKETQTVKRGRPRQPFCKDCLQEGKQILKDPGLGYCKIHLRIRHKIYREASREGREVTNMEEERFVALGQRVRDLEAENANLVAMVKGMEKANLGLMADADGHLRRELTEMRAMARMFLHRLRELVPEEYPLSRRDLDF